MQNRHVHFLLVPYATIAYSVCLLLASPVLATNTKWQEAVSNHPGCTASHYSDVVERYLSYYSDGIKAEDVSAAAALVAGIGVSARVLVVNNVVYVDFLGTESWIKDFVAFSIQALACKYKLPDMDLVLQIGDVGVSHPRSADERSPPVFSWVRSEPLHKDLLMPYYPGCCHSRRKHLLHLERHLHAWDDRDSKAVWRGSTTGGFFRELEDWRNCPRGQAVLFCQQEPELCDAGFTALVQVGGDSPEDREERHRRIWENIVKARANGTYIPTIKQSGYKYVLLLDGNGAPSSRSIEAMLTGSTVIKPVSSSVEFFYSRLDPWQHYVPIAGIDNLNSTIRWLQANDDAAKQIGKNSRAFALKYLSREYMECYMLDLLYGYAALLQYAPQVPGNATQYRMVNDLLSQGNREEMQWFLNGACPNSSIKL